ncbi:MAG: isoprenylcysteine carboxylmethyltransferase family protein [Terracidiphilus sp.]|jgi:protein-S-isoprenylcysteine O-methyltransferase Ste14
MNLGLMVAPRMLFILALSTAVIFLPAGSWRFWQGWATLAAFYLPALLAFFYLLRYDRALVERRMRSREPLKEQKLLIRLTLLVFLGAALLPGFDRRFGWSHRLFGDVPAWVTLISLALIIGGYLFVFWVLKVNSFAGRTITVDPGQTVVSTGPYAWVRHPMYFGSVVLWTFISLALGSWVALPAFALIIPFFAIRLLSEEKFLRANLPGYTTYCARTRYHLIPFIW